MRFGGHETFPVREGWLSRGLKLLNESPEKLSDEFAEDYLGVGRNMAKSIRHWLVATGLAEKQGGGRGKSAVFGLTSFGSIVLENDPHLLDQTTWWMLHINLVNTPEHAASWHWFFNHWNHRRFEKAVCVENLRRYLKLTSKRQPNVRTLERDIGCLLATYSRKVPQEKVDPEDASECPFQELGLMHHFRGSGYYSMIGAQEGIPPMVFGYCFARALMGKDWEITEFSLTELERMSGGPGRCFGLDAESLFDNINRFTTIDYLSPYFKVKGLAGQRVVEFGALGKTYGQMDYVDEWAKSAYSMERTLEVAHV